MPLGGRSIVRRPVYIDVYCAATAKAQQRAYWAITAVRMGSSATTRVGGFRVRGLKAIPELSGWKAESAYPVCL
jgi:hypothetical protein